MACAQVEDAFIIVLSGGSQSYIALALLCIDVSVPWWWKGWRNSEIFHFQRFQQTTLECLAGLSIIVVDGTLAFAWLACVALLLAGAFEMSASLTGPNGLSKEYALSYQID